VIFKSFELPLTLPTAVTTSKVNPDFVAVPPGVVTLIFPVVPDPTTAVILVDELTANDDAAVPPKLTEVAPVKFVPVIVIVAPVVAEIGLKDEIVGAGINVNPVFVAVPAGVVTLTFPDAPEPTTAVIVVELTTANDAAATPPKLTEVAPLRFVPVTVTVTPVAAVVGVKEVIVGADKNINPGFDAVPFGVVMLTLPVAPTATTAVMVLESTTVNDAAATPPKLTAVAPVKFVPVMVTLVPAPALAGMNEVMFGPSSRFLNIEMRLSGPLDTQRSGLP